ncbi:tyrosine-type recombinase/integrase [Escherichia coli]|nr:tyrosine-type recombinase/integrase [Escherichia coli]MCK2266121.1 tyrosine-type recombinase/integrase [Escherichia coli]MCN4832505.1 tyrosine-type recombinase/integrase [Escherichia coli]MCN5264379.1 tyrosine-type recombinase/integrase [Escherichia coli]MCN8983403.1 tyrosine-type recombinase/integrase [Escherichia coli]MCS0847151.1 tyrosine-type recombinase/integrase [Escherichia coli]
MQHIENDHFMIKTTFIETNKESIKMKGISQALKNVDEVKTVAAELQRNSKTNLFYCLWVFMYESGLRVSDVLKLKYQDVEGQSHLKIKQEKTGNVVRPKVTPAMLSVVAQRKAEQTKMPVATDFIFSAGTLRSKGEAVTRNTVFTEFGKMGRRAGFSNVGCHTPRKSRGRVMFDAGVAIETIAHFLGQTDPRSTMYYIGYGQDVQDDLAEEFSLEW